MAKSNVLYYIWSWSTVLTALCNFTRWILFLVACHRWSVLVLKYLGRTIISSEQSSINCHDIVSLLFTIKKFETDIPTERTKFMLVHVARATAWKCTVDDFGYSRLSSAPLGLIIDHNKYVRRELHHSKRIVYFLPTGKKEISLLHSGRR